MTKRPTAPLSRREREILDILYRAGRATAAEVQEQLPRSPSYSAVRSLLRILEGKGHIRHEQDGPRYVYTPTLERDTAQRSALRHLIQTFFDGSINQAVAALLSEPRDKVSPDEWDELARMIEQARKEGR
jgi:predicted transcriptional regulator